VTMKIAVVWDMMPCGCCRKWRFGVTYRLHQGDKNLQARNNASSN
jgi:hypothetical protein